jgi:hypothetical protein
MAITEKGGLDKTTDSRKDLMTEGNTALASPPSNKERCRSFGLPDGVELRWRVWKAETRQQEAVKL